MNGVGLRLACARGPVPPVGTPAKTTRPWRPIAFLKVTGAGSKPRARKKPAAQRVRGSVGHTPLLLLQTIAEFINYVKKNFIR